MTRHIASTSFQLRQLSFLKLCQTISLYLLIAQNSVILAIISLSHSLASPQLVQVLSWWFFFMLTSFQLAYLQSFVVLLNQNNQKQLPNISPFYKRYFVSTYSMSKRNELYQLLFLKYYHDTKHVLIVPKLGRIMGTKYIQSLRLDKASILNTRLMCPKLPFITHLYLI